MCEYFLWYVSALTTMRSLVANAFNTEYRQMSSHLPARDAVSWAGPTPCLTWPTTCHLPQAPPPLSVGFAAEAKSISVQEGSGTVRLTVQLYN